jgi:hypothetical protein
LEDYGRVRLEFLLLVLVLVLDSLAVSLPTCSAQWSKSFVASQHPRQSRYLLIGVQRLLDGSPNGHPRQGGKAHSEERKTHNSRRRQRNSRRTSARQSSQPQTTPLLPSPGQLDSQSLTLDLQQWTERTSGPGPPGVRYYANHGTYSIS